MSEIPEWAMQKAREYVVAMPLTTPTMFDVQSVIALALMSADREATERCAEIAATAELYSGSHLINSDPRVTIAAAIRKGTHND